MSRGSRMPGGNAAQQRAFELYFEVRSYAKVAKSTGVNQRTIERWGKKLDWPTLAARLDAASPR